MIRAVATTSAGRDNIGGAILRKKPLRENALSFRLFWKPGYQKDAHRVTNREGLRIDDNGEGNVIRLTVKYEILIQSTASSYCLAGSRR